jgi:hypothetical protein
VPFLKKEVNASDFKVHPDLENVKNAYYNAMNGVPIKLSDEDYVKMRNKFIHISWSYKNVKNIYIDVIKPYEPEDRPIGKSYINRERMKHSPK